MHPLKISLFLAVLLAAAPLTLWGQSAAPEDHPLYKQLVRAGYAIAGVGEKFGVAYVEIVIPPGEAIYTVCRRVPLLNARFVEARDAIAYFNALNPFYQKTPEEESFSINVSTLKIPLDLTRRPEIFPRHDQSLARHDKFLLLDVGKEYLALYERGVLLKVYPISPGTVSGGGRSITPLGPFTIRTKIEDAYSARYDDAWMPFAMNVGGPYWIHGGVLPGRPDSRGCIRMFIEHAQELYGLVQVGTPGRIINSSLPAATARATNPAPVAE